MSTSPKKYKTQLLTTIHDGIIIEIEKYNKLKIKRAVAYDYNKKMGGVDNSR